jgi:hypothetical protein
VIVDGPIPIECGKCLPSTATDTQDGRRAHLKVFGHAPEYVPAQREGQAPDGGAS